MTNTLNSEENNKINVLPLRIEELIKGKTRYAYRDQSDLWNEWKEKGGPWEPCKGVSDGSNSVIEFSIPEEDQKYYYCLYEFIFCSLISLSDKASELTVKYNQLLGEKDGKAAEELREELLDHVEHYECMIMSIIANLDYVEILGIRNVDEALKSTFH